MVTALNVVAITAGVVGAVVLVVYVYSLFR